jgi:hypothetical protein
MEIGILAGKCGLVNPCSISVTITMMGIGTVFIFGNFILVAIARRE